MFLNKGDTIGIIALSGECERDKIISSVNFLESSGFKVKLSNNIDKQVRYLAGSDKEKTEELHRFFLDEDIKLVLCARGGYGAIRIINDIDYEIIKQNPKPFCGFSDVTALLLMIYQKAGIEVYHGPMACSDFTNINWYTQNSFCEALSGKEIYYQSNREPYKEGICEGILWGGNLSTVVSLCGIDFIPEKDFIFFAEDINEPVYKIDKMFYQLLNINKFKKYCKGIVLGDFLATDNAEWLNDLFKELGGKLNIPVSGGFKITHNDEKITLPIGRLSRLENNILRVYRK